MKKIVKRIGEEYDNYPLIKYLKIIQPNWTKIFSIKMIRTKNVLINQQKTTINYRLKAGDRVDLYGYDDRNKTAESLNLKKLKPLKVVYEDKNLIIVNKEIGIPVQEDEKNILNNMNNRLLNHINWKPDNRQKKWKPTFIHRLDRNTSGLLIGAKTYKAYEELNTAMKNKDIDKYYQALVQGLVPFKERTIKNYLLKIPSKNRVIESEKTIKGAKEAISELKLIKHIAKNKETLLEIKLITGRTHQIRAHLSGIGFPIRGDQKYGIEKDKKKYPYPQLKACRLVFSNEIKGSTLNSIKGRVFTIDGD